MTYDVILTYPHFDSSISFAATRWCEFMIGDAWFGWDCAPIWGQNNEELFRFEHKKHAEEFKAIFGRTVNEMRIIPYDLYRYYWINQFGRDRLANTFMEKGWTPQVVVPSNIVLNRKRKLDGGKVLFRRNVGWFFEREQDALMFLLVDFDEGHD